MRVTKEGFFRSNRFICINGEWYFQTREFPEPVGPFESKDAAIKASEVFLKFTKSKGREQNLKNTG